MKIIPKAIWKKTVLLVVILLGLIQFIPKPKKNLSDSISAASIEKLYPVPDSVMHILKIACYDCHSNNTYYPWYSNVQPFAWYLNNHIADGKKELNFDEFGNYSVRQQKSKLKAIASQIEDNEMPLTSYKLIHPDARLNKEEKQLIINWAKNYLDSLNSKN
ncbi:MAG: cytochrome C [Terrimonas sp.]|nr:cytochrome C [Terrimonas sp.]